MRFGRIGRNKEERSRRTRKVTRENGIKRKRINEETEKEKEKERY